VIDKVAKSVLHQLNGNRKMYYDKVQEIAADAKDKVVLEIGSGKLVNGKYDYSAEHLFPSAKEFIKTDINPDFGHQVLDITQMNAKSRYDIVLCLNVLEHVYDFQTAVDNLHKSLKKNGKLVVAVPFAFPLHDEPGDYWRFTEHSLQKILGNFSDVTITPQRLRRWPTGYLALAKK
jgi:SAM-dependent methyltransferase